MIHVFKGIIIGIVIFLVLTLNGCGGEHTIIKEVKVPVPIACKVIVPERPLMPLEQAKKEEADIFIIMKKALAEIELRQGYETKLESAIIECNK